MKLQVRTLVTAGLLVGIMGVTSGCAVLGRPGGQAIVDEPGWTTDPTASDPAFLAAADEECLDRPGERPSPDVEPVEDQRGPNGAAFLWSFDGRGIVCFVEATGGLPSLRYSIGTNDEAGSGVIFETQESWISPSIIGGKVDDPVTSVDVETNSGRLVHATVGDGQFLAWWPGPDRARTVRAFAVDGSTLATIQP